VPGDIVSVAPRRIERDRLDVRAMRCTERAGIGEQRGRFAVSASVS